MPLAPARAQLRKGIEIFAALSAITIVFNGDIIAIFRGLVKRYYRFQESCRIVLSRRFVSRDCGCWHTACSKVRHDEISGRTAMNDAIPFGRRTLGRLAAGAGVALAAPAVIGHAEPASLHIAQLQSLTGPSAAYGLKSRDGTLLAMDDLNKTGIEIGGTTYKIVMPVDDMANDARQAVTLLRQYASDASVVGVLGPTNSVGFLPIIPAAAQLEIPVICNGSGAPVKEWNPWACRVNLVSAVATPVMLKKLHAALGFKKFAVIYDQTQDSQRGDAEFCKAEAPKIGFDIVAYEAFRANDQDFSAQISTIRAAKPDAILGRRRYRRWGARGFPDSRRPAEPTAADPATDLFRMRSIGMARKVSWSAAIAGSASICRTRRRP